MLQLTKGNMERYKLLISLVIKSAMEGESTSVLFKTVDNIIKTA